MNKPTVEQVTTDDGCHSLYVPSLDEHYHSTHGAFNEAMHVFITNGFQTTSGPVAILEVGFGTGLNAWLTCLQAAETGRKVAYTGLETYPLPIDLVTSLNYDTFSTMPLAGEWYKKLHAAGWETPEKITENFTLTKTETPVQNIAFDAQFDVIYFDAFGPRKQPDMWTVAVFENMMKALKPNGFFSDLLRTRTSETQHESRWFFGGSFAWPSWET